MRVSTFLYQQLYLYSFDLLVFLYSFILFTLIRSYDMGNIFMNHEEAEHLEKRIGHSVEIEGCIGYLVEVESYRCENKDSD